MPQQALRCAKAKQGMRKATVPHEDLWRFDEALADILVPGLQAPDQHEIHKQMKVAADGLTGDPKTLGKGRSVQQTPLCMRKHSPEAAQCGCWMRGPRAGMSRSR